MVMGLYAKSHVLFIAVYGSISIRRIRKAGEFISKCSIQKMPCWTGCSHKFGHFVHTEGHPFERNNRHFP